MSNNESFIDEVNEEVRRDQLFTYIRKYGWIAALTVVGLVGATAWTEYQAAQTRAAEQAAGDAIFDALDQNEWADRQAAFAQLPASVMSLLMTGAAAQEAGDTAAAADAFTALANLDGARQIYRDLGAFKALLANSANLSPEERIAGFETLAAPGATFALLAKEQIAVAQLEAGDAETALATLREISGDATVMQGLRNRVEALIVALGGDASQ